MADFIIATVPTNMVVFIPVAIAVARPVRMFAAWRVLGQNRWPAQADVIVGGAGPISA